MKITDLHIDGFGVWRDLSMESLSDRVTVIYGENEAGKTTLMHFVRTVLYGFSSDRRDRYVPPVNGGQPGGGLTIALPHGRYRVRRHTNGAGSGEGQVEITSVDGSYQSCHQLATLLGGVDEAIFSNVFAVGLREIQQLATLNDTEAAQHLYDLTTGLDRVSLFEVMRELKASRQEIISDDEHPSQLTQLHAQRQKLEEELRLLRSRTGEWVQLAGQVRTSNEEIAELERRSSSLERETRLVEIGCNVREPWQQRAEADARLDALGTLAEVPLEELDTLERLAVQISEHRDLLHEIKQRRQTLRDRAATVGLNEKLWRQRARVEALSEQRPWVASLLDQVTRLETDILEMDGKLAAEHRQFGLSKSRTSDGSVPQLTDDNLHSLRQPLREIREQKHRLDEARHEVEQCEDRARQLHERLSHELNSRGVDSLAEAMERSGGRVSQSRRQSQTDDRVHRLLRHRDDAQQQSRSLLDRQVMPLRALVALGVLFTTGTVMVLTAMLYQVFAMPGSTAGVLAVMGMAALMLTGAIKFVYGQVVGRQLDESHRQEELVQMQLDKVMAERGLTDEESIRGEAVNSRAREAERELAALEELVPLESERDLALQQADAARSRVAQVEQAYQSARNDWRSTLRSMGLPRNLTPKKVKEYASGCRLLGEKQERINARRDELEQRRAELAGIGNRTGQLLLETGIEPTSLDVIDRIHQLTTELERQTEFAERRNELAKEYRGLRQENSRQMRARRKLKRQQREVLHRVGVDGNRESGDLLEKLREVRQLRTTRDELASRISASLGVVCTEEELAQHVDGATQGQLEKRHDALLTQYDGTADQLKNLYERRGRVTEQMETLAQDRRLAEVQVELSAVEQRIDETVGRWQALAVISLILEEIRVLYESDRQPESLREASGYLTQLTRGRYTRVWTPLGDNILRVDDSGGHALPVEYLSRGTREQVYLSLRLALVSAYARRGVLLPLVLDDVLVNFDKQRAEAAANVLGAFAESGHQILVFTCHEHIMQIFRQLGVEVRELPLHNRRGNVAPVAPLVTVPAKKIEPPPPVIEEEEIEEEEFEEELVEEEEELVAEAEEEYEEEEYEEEEEELDLADDDFKEPEEEFEFATTEAELIEEEEEEEELVELTDEEEEPVEDQVVVELEEEQPEEEPEDEPEEDYASDETAWEEDEEYEYIDDDEAARRVAWAEVTEWEEDQATTETETTVGEKDDAEAA